MKEKIKEICERLNRDQASVYGATNELFDLFSVVVPKGKFCKWEDHNKNVEKYGECLVCYKREKQLSQN